MAYNQELANRIRVALSAGPAAVREVSMFGGLSFIVNGKIALTANNAGDMMLKVDPARVDDFLGQGAKPAEMGQGRRMSAGWIVVGAGNLESDEDLRQWVDAALDYNRSATGKSTRRH